MRPIRINQAIEVELIEFKKEIESKFATSLMNREFFFPWRPVTRDTIQDGVQEDEEALDVHEDTQIRLVKKKILKPNNKVDLNLYVS